MKIKIILQVITLFTFSYTQCMELIQQSNKIRPKILILSNHLLNKIIIKNKNEFKDHYFDNLNKRLSLLQKLTEHKTKICFINIEKNLDYWFTHNKKRFTEIFYEKLFIFLNYNTVIATPSCSNSTDQKHHEIFITSLIFNNSLLCITNQHPVKDNVKKILNEFLGVYKGDIADKKVNAAIQKIKKNPEITQPKYKPENNQHTLPLDQSFITKFIQNQRQTNKSLSNDAYKYNKAGMYKLLLLQLLIDNKADVTYININNTQQPLLTDNNKPCHFFYDQLYFLLNYNTYSEREVTINRVLYDQTTFTTTLQLDNSLLHISLKKARPNTLNTLTKLLELHAQTAYNEFLYIPEYEHPFITENESLKLVKKDHALFTSLSCNTQQFILDITHNIT